MPFLFGESTTPASPNYRVICDERKAQHLHKLIFADAKRNGYSSLLLQRPVREWGSHEFEPEIQERNGSNGPTKTIKEIRF